MRNTDIEDMFASLGPVQIRRMFGGKGIYCQGCIVAIEIRDEIMLKADALSAPVFAQAGARQWVHEGETGRTVAMPYWSIPHAALDDPDEMTRWAGLALAAARRAPPKRSGTRPARASKPARTRQATPSR